MNSDLDNALCEKYPKIFASRHLSMTETCMCWGFCCGEGWYNIIDQLCANIQHHIDWSYKQNQDDLEYNAMIDNMRAGNFDEFNEYLSGMDESFLEKRKQEMLANGPRKVREVVPQVVADQVKEKFGTLRFYYHGGDEYVRGLVDMAEGMSGVTCEKCGAPGVRRGGGWVHTYCDKHEEEYQQGVVGE